MKNRSIKNLPLFFGYTEDEFYEIKNIDAFMVDLILNY